MPTDMPRANDYLNLQAPDFFAETDPFALFDAWLADARKHEVNDAAAMSVASIDENGFPDVRIVMLRGIDKHGFVFFTDFGSPKAVQLLASPAAALCFHWKSLRRQVRVRGTVAQVEAPAADGFFNSRTRDGKLGLWASRQSSILESRGHYHDEVERYRQQFDDGKIPRPDRWSGFRVSPGAFDFWHDRPDKLHDRVKFFRSTDASPWQKERLFP